MMAAHPGFEMSWFVLPDERDGSDKAVHSTGVLDGRLNDRADGQPMCQKATEEHNICPGYQLSTDCLKACKALLLQVCCNKQGERDPRAHRTSTGH